MKITKKMLEQIIKEEIERSLQENKEVKVKEKIEEEWNNRLTSSFKIVKLISETNKKEF